MNEIMAEIVQLGLQDTKAINLRAAASSKSLPYLTFVLETGSSLCRSLAQLPVLQCFPHIFIFFKHNVTKQAVLYAAVAKLIN